MNNKILRKRSLLVIIVTILMMLAEIYYGLISNSMALLADGFHMGTHAIAFSITFIVCIIAIKHEDKTEKLNALGGYTSAILLGFTSIGIIWESCERLFNPISISFTDAIIVAVIGLVINLLCMAIMGNEHEHTNCHHHEHHHENLNFKAAYLHISADAMTSILAIAALILGKYLGWTLLDPIIGVFGGCIIAKWAITLIKDSSKILLDW